MLLRLAIDVAELANIIGAREQYGRAVEMVLNHGTLNVNKSAQALINGDTSLATLRDMVEE